MIRENIPKKKSPTQHLTYRPRHLVDVSEPPGDGEGGSEGGGRQIKK